MKQETLEEAATKYLHSVADGERYTGYADEDFINGAKWQAERMYSEEEVMDMFHDLSMHLPLHYEFLVKEQFKNK